MTQSVSIHCFCFGLTIERKTRVDLKFSQFYFGCYFCCCFINSKLCLSIATIIIIFVSVTDQQMAFCEHALELQQLLVLVVVVAVMVHRL